MSLETGINAGVQLFNAYKGNQRADERQSWDRRQFDKLKQELDDEDLIRKAGMESVAMPKADEKPAEQKAGALPKIGLQQELTGTAMPPAEAAPVRMPSMQSRQAGPEFQDPLALKDSVPMDAMTKAPVPSEPPMQTQDGSPVPQDYRPARDGLAVPQALGPASGDQTMERLVGPQQTGLGGRQVLNTGPTPDNPGAAQRFDPASYGEGGGGMTQNGGVRIEPPMAQRAQQPQQAVRPAQPGQQPGMPRATTFEDLDRANTVYLAQYNKALELGRPDLAMKYHVAGMQGRDQMRVKAFDNARTQFSATGDPNAFVPAFNKYVANGTTVQSIQKSGDGYQLQGKTDDGKAFNQKLTGQQMEQYIRYASDPKTARAAEAKRAEELYKASVEIQKQTAKDRWQKVGSGETLIDTSRPGASFTGPAKEATDNWSTVTRKNEDGSESLYQQNKATGEIRPVGGQQESDGIPKAVHTMQNEARSAVLRANGASSLNGMDPKNQARVEQQTFIASKLIGAAHGTDNWRGMSPDAAATIAKAVMDGRAQVVPMRVPGRSEPVNGVEFEGRKYLLDPYATQDARSAKARPSDSLGKVDPAKQKARDADRRVLLEREMADAKQALATAKTPEATRAAQESIDALSRELK